MIIVYFNDRKLLNAMKRAGLVEKGTYPGQWLIEERWSPIGQEVGIAVAMAEAASRAFNAAFGERARASVEHWWS